MALLCHVSLLTLFLGTVASDKTFRVHKHASFPGPSSRLQSARVVTEARGDPGQQARLALLQEDSRPKRSTRLENWAWLGGDLQPHASEPELKKSKIAWLHVPKTGTSFANTLVTWACQGLDTNDAVDERYENATSGTQVKNFLETHKDLCPKTLNICGGHHALGNGECNNYAQHEGSFVGLFRKPDQRVISGYYARQASIAGKYDLPAYAKATRGCVVKMLNGIDCAEYSHGTQEEGTVAITQNMVQQAHNRLVGGFAFVGLTEEWALSVCLFHAMFGGQCHAREFLNTRPTPGALVQKEEATEALRDWADPYDGKLYETAHRLFWNSVSKHQTTHMKCENVICKDAKEAYRATAMSSPSYKLAK